MLIRNPFFKKIQLTNRNEAAASYKGIALKSLWYWVLCLGGVLAYCFLPLTAETSLLLGAGVLIAVICPIITYCFPMTACVAGSLYSVVQGYLLALICQTYIKEYAMLIWLAVGITALVFAVMSVLYFSGVIRINRKLRAAFLTMLIASIVGSAIVYASSFFTNALINIFSESGTIYVAVTVGALLIAVINLVFEFDFTVGLVSDGACKKYEWTAAYGLFMSIVLIFIRILEILEKIMPKKEK